MSVHVGPAPHRAIRVNATEYIDGGTTYLYILTMLNSPEPVHVASVARGAFAAGLLAKKR